MTTASGFGVTARWREQHYKELAPHLRGLCEAFQAGVKKFMQEHPSRSPPGRPNSSHGRSSRWAAILSGAGPKAKPAAT